MFLFVVAIFRDCNSSYLRAPAPDLLCGVAIKLKPVAKAPEYSPLIFRNAMLEACDNCKMMMKHASIIYDDWHNQGIVYCTVADTEYSLTFPFV